MTCIVGLVHGDKVIIGGDSAGVSGWDITIREDAKVFKNGPFLIGCTSSFRMIQILRFGFKPPKIKGDLYKYMCTSFIDEVRKTFEEKGFLQKASEGDERGGCFLVGIRGRLFSIDSDFQVGESHIGFNVLGCGHAYAAGSLFFSRGQRAKKRVRNALRAAEHFSAGVVGPFIIKTT